MSHIFDRIFALISLIVLSPLLLISFLGVKFSSPGPFLYSTNRVGLNGKLFRIYKIRSMNVQSSEQAGPKITSRSDCRVFPFGHFLRLSKIDELPQLFNILKGEMVIVGPRPEDPEIVEKFYRGWHFQTLSVRPGLTSPGALYNYTHFDLYITGVDPDREYIEKFLDQKLALDAVYASNKSFIYDIKIIFRTVYQIIKVCLGQKTLKNPPESVVATVNYKVKYRVFGKTSTSNDMEL